jgi:phosphoglycolate phosphatase-like HAD superfamily hydrolase
MSTTPSTSLVSTPASANLMLAISPRARLARSDGEVRPRRQLRKGPNQIGKGGDKLIPVFLSAGEQRDHGKEMEEWRGNRFKTEYLPLVRPFSAVPSLLRRVRDGGLRIAIASSAKKDELEKYLDIARITNLVDVTTSSDDAEESKPAPDIFEIVLRKLKIEGADAVAIGDTPYDAEAAVKAKIAAIGVLCGGFTESSLREGGCIEIYPGPATLFARFADSPLAR